MALCGLWLVLGAPWSEAGAAEKNRENPYISKATRLYEDFKYTEALRTLEKAAAWPSNTPEQNVFIALVEGVLRFENQQPEQGESAFKRALAIDPKAQLPFSVSPKISETLEMLREQMTVVAGPNHVETMEPVEPPPPPIGPNPGLSSKTPTNPLLSTLSQYRMPLALTGGGLAVVGILSWTQAKSLEQRVRVADPSITTRAQLDGSLRDGRTFETAGWILLGTGVTTAIGSLLFLDAPASVPNVAGAPTDGGAQVFLHWSIP
ncbi:TPR domain protein [Archangium gephyra]|uniref:TPR domain protein n=1 Tax=Archangium gephyra TaxID=48 RepID=A0AAC8QC50_9BACT|nr:TPR domain protein [Archangium gephyra]